LHGRITMRQGNLKIKKYFSILGNEKKPAKAHNMYTTMYDNPCNEVADEAKDIKPERKLVLLSRLLVGNDDMDLDEMITRAEELLYIEEDNEE